MPGYLQTKRDNHIKYGHQKMAEDIALYLRATFTDLQIEGPAVAEMQETWDGVGERAQAARTGARGFLARLLARFKR